MDVEQRDNLTFCAASAIAGCQELLFQLIPKRRLFDYFALISGCILKHKTELMIIVKIADAP